MAKRKLSEAQRGAIRKEISELLRNGKTQAETLRLVAKKYDITTVTARWYLNSLKSPPSSSAKKAAAAKPKAVPARKAPKAAGRKSKPAPARKAPKAAVHRNGNG